MLSSVMKLVWERLKDRRNRNLPGVSSTALTCSWNASRTPSKNLSSPGRNVFSVYRDKNSAVDRLMVTKLDRKWMDNSKVIFETRLKYLYGRDDGSPPVKEGCEQMLVCIVVDNR